MIFDDYLWPQYRDQPTKHPKLGIDAFLPVLGEKL